MTQRRKVALVTGGAGGICLEVVLRLCPHVDAVFAVDADAAALAALERRRLPNLRPVHADVTESAAVTRLFADLQEQDHLPNILVNGVGGDARRIPFEVLGEDEPGEAIRRNLLHIFTLCRAGIPAMKAQGWGRIVNFSSIAGRTYTLFSNAAYVAAKAAVLGVTRQLAFEYAAYGITVNAVAHGPILTDRIAEAWSAKPEAEQGRILGQIPAGRLGTIAEAAGAVLYLCSEDAGYTTGATIDVNGGLLC